MEEKFLLCQQVFDEARLPLIFRVTPMSEPSKLDSWLESKGLRLLEDTRVMVNDDLGTLVPESLPAGIVLQRAGHAAFAHILGQMRGSPLSQQQAHAHRLELSPVPFEGWVLRRSGQSGVLACGQTAVEADMVGVYDVFTTPEERNSGWARKLCGQLLARARNNGARIGYLQVDASNLAARSVYGRLGFKDGYAYHYRTASDSLE
jgi:GNAT superfamily N-acetyltransferase